MLHTVKKRKTNKAEWAIYPVIFEGVRRPLNLDQGTVLQTVVPWMGQSALHRRPTDALMPLWHWVQMLRFGVEAGSGYHLSTTRRGHSVAFQGDRLESRQSGPAVGPMTPHKTAEVLRHCVCTLRPQGYTRSGARGPAADSPSSAAATPGRW